jgi:hypothetical protein
MKRTRRREVVIEREETVVLRAGTPVRGRQACPICGPGSLLLMPEEASCLHGESVRTICRWAETGEVHSLDAADGRLLVCLGSLAQRASRAAADLSANSDSGATKLGSRRKP